MRGVAPPGFEPTPHTIQPPRTITLDAGYAWNDDGRTQHLIVRELSAPQLVVAAPALLGSDQLSASIAAGQADVRLAGDRLEIKSLRLDSNLVQVAGSGAAALGALAAGGSLASAADAADVEVHGQINLAELTLGEFDLTMTADDFLAIDSREYEAVVDADLTLQGTTAQPVLGGDLEIQRAEINLTEQTTAPDLENVQLTERDLRTLEQRFGIRVTEDDTTTFDFYEALAMNLNVVLERDTWLRSRTNPRMDIQFGGSLDLRKIAVGDLAGASASLSGTLSGLNLLPSLKNGRFEARGIDIDRVSRLHRLPPELVDFMRGRGRGRVLFGSNWPMLSPARCLEHLDKLGLDDEARHEFLAGAARRVFFKS